MTADTNLINSPYYLFQKSSNPVFMRTILFSHLVADKSDIKLEAYDMRERYTSTSTLLGTATTSISELKHGERIRLKLDSPNPDGRTAGFVTLTTWMFEAKIPASTDSTPVHRPSPKLQSSYDEFIGK